MIIVEVERKLKVKDNMFCIGGGAGKKEARQLVRMNARVRGYLCNNVLARMELVNMIQGEISWLVWLCRAN